jgi:predicted aspartyl protease
MRGVFTADREAVIELEVCGPAGAKLAVAAVVDTGFTGYLTFPQDVINALGLRYHSQTTALLADGSRVAMAK